MSGTFEECRVDGCDNPVRNKPQQLCHKHYEKWRRYPDRDLNTDLRQDPAFRKKPYTDPTKRCTICRETKDVENFYKSAKGNYSSYCKPCHRKVSKANNERRKREGGQTPRASKVYPPCEFDGCEKTSALKGKLKQTDTERVYLCKAHWTQYHNGKDCKPLRKHRRSHINDEIRQCTTCDRILPVDAFYTRTNGARQSQCKRCMGLYTRYGFLVREGRLEEAQIVAESMPERLRNKYLGTGAGTNKKEVNNAERGSDCIVGETPE